MRAKEPIEQIHISHLSEMHTAKKENINHCENMHKPLRALCVIETLGRGGGAEQLVCSLAPELRKLGVYVEFVDLCSWPDDMGVELESMGFKVNRLMLPNRRHVLTSMIKFRQILVRGHFDLIWAHGLVGNFHGQIGKMVFGNIPSIVTLHSEGYSAAPPKSLFSRFVVWIEGWLNSKANARIGVSHAVAKDYQSYFGWRDIKVIYNGIPTSSIPNSIAEERCHQIRREYGIDPKDYLIVVPARLVKKKGHVYLLQALEILTSTYRIQPKVILLSGEDVERRHIESYIESHKMSGFVKIRKPLAHPQLFELLLTADAVALPSLREPFGIAAAEAMTTGTPVVLTRVDGFIELVGDSEGALMVQPANPQELADAIIKLMQNPELSVELGKKGRRRILDQFSIEACATAWRDEFVQVIEKK